MPTQLMPASFAPRNNVAITATKTTFGLSIGAARETFSI